VVGRRKRSGTLAGCLLSGVESLFLSEARWILLLSDELSSLLGQPPLGRLCAAQDALRWLLRCGMAVPDPLQEIAGKWRLPPSLSINSRNTARRGKEGTGGRGRLFKTANRDRETKSAGDVDAGRLPRQPSRSLGRLHLSDQRL